MSTGDIIQAVTRGIIAGIIINIAIGVWAINTKIDGLIKLEIATEECKHDSTTNSKQ